MSGVLKTFRMWQTEEDEEKSSDSSLNYLASLKFSKIEKFHSYLRTERASGFVSFPYWLNTSNLSQVNISILSRLTLIFIPKHFL